MPHQQTNKPWSRWMVAAAATFVIASSHSEEAKRDLIVFNTRAQVTVDAEGHATAVKVAPDLPEPIAQFVQQQVAQWRFQAPVIDGQARGGQTWLSLGACAVPVAQGYQLAVEYKGSGPAPARTDGLLIPPRYPSAAARQGIEMDATVTFVVQPDGRAELESIDYGNNKSQRRTFEPGLKEWVAAMRYEPERVDDQPVRTRMNILVTYRTGDISRGSRERAAELKSECQTALRDGDQRRPIALDSPFKRLETGG